MGTRLSERSGSTTTLPRDHRVDVAEKKRERMRARILDATMRVFANQGHDRPVIEDVVREAGVSRGTFYKYFDSLDEALIAVGQQLSDNFTMDILPVYDVLKEPWQRVAVGFRTFLTRALLDIKWAGFVTRMDVWPHESLVAHYMSSDLELGKKLGQFTFDDVDAATDFLMGASAGGIQAIRQGVADPRAYIDAAVRMSMRSLGCDRERCDQGVRFSYVHLAAWTDGEIRLFTPV